MEDRAMGRLRRGLYRGMAGEGCDAKMGSVARW